jgi:hypothetical protein
MFLHRRAYGTAMATTDQRVLEFIRELKQAIENGEFQNQAAIKGNDSNSASNNENDDQSKIINVNNLSNQTFNYIINWLKQQSQANEVIVLHFLSILKIIYYDRF